MLTTTPHSDTDTLPSGNDNDNIRGVARAYSDIKTSEPRSFLPSVASGRCGEVANWVIMEFSIVTSWVLVYTLCHHGIMYRMTPGRHLGF